MNQTTKEFRKKIADEFVKALTEKELDWKKNWSAGGMESPVNAVTGKRYNGINRFRLMLIGMTAAEHGGAVDNRWATFKQIQDKGWKLKKGSKGHQVEYWKPYDFAKKTAISWKEYQDNVRNPDRNVGLIAKYYYVFNGRDIEGIPELEKPPVRNVVSDEIITKISNGMQVSLTNDGGGRAFYRPSDDSIHLPKPELFFSTYDYNATALHELSHATGAKHRLNREMGNVFGSEKYAYEELVAEIASCFMGEHLQIEQTAEHIENHKAYVQSWISEISEKPDILVRAIRDAGEAANLLELHAEILTKEEYQETLQESMEVPQEQGKEMQPEIKDMEAVLASYLEGNKGEELKTLLWTLDYKVKLPVLDASSNIVKQQVAEAQNGRYRISVGFNNTYDPKMVGEVRKPIKQSISAVIYEQDKAIKVIPLCEMESKSISNAQKNYETVLEQWKNYTKQEQITFSHNKNADLKMHGYKPTATLLRKMETLDQITGKHNTVRDIHAAYKNKTFRDNPEADKVVQNISKIMQTQELAKMPASMQIR